jgi:hypothetical protein
MAAQYDIFKKTPNNDFIWLEEVEDISHARKRLIHLTSTELLNTGFGTAPVKCSLNPWTIAPKELEFSAFSMKMTLATWREARGESTETQRGIFHTALNRGAKS